MYARYVPSPGVKLDEVNLDCMISPETQLDASTTYARYIPSSKSKYSHAEQPSPNSVQYRRGSNAAEKNFEEIKTKSSESFNYNKPEDINSHSDVSAQPRKKSVANLSKPPLNKKKANISEEFSAIQDVRTAPASGRRATKKRKRSDPKTGSDLETANNSTKVQNIVPEDANPLKQSLSDSSNVRNYSSSDEERDETEIKHTSVPGEKIDLLDKRHAKLLQKKETSMQRAEILSKDIAESENSIIKEPAELHNLTPLPQPSPLREVSHGVSEDSLPNWLACPIRVAPQTDGNFDYFNLETHVIKALQQNGFSKTFALQSVAIPLLLSEVGKENGDFVISAATGSGKTLAYLLPMIKDVAKYRVQKLRGLVILPTRELVFQAKEVAEVCAMAFSKSDQYKRVKIGTSVGNETLKSEQYSLIERTQKYDPQEYEKQLFDAERLWQETEDVNGGIQRIFTENDLMSLPCFVDEFKMKVDILICTPGRLVEHLKSSPGFSLNDIRWLVIDEADKLLGQSFQQWLPLVMSQVESQYRNLTSRRKHLRKVVLSATMTKNLGQLTQLKLHRPSLILLEGENIASGQSKVKSEEYILPSSLREFAVKVEEDDLKPLYLLELLRRQAIIRQESNSRDTNSLSDDLTSESESDKSSSISSVISSKDTPPRQDDTNPTLHGALVFTKSNETAVRLGRLIALLLPSLSSLIGVLTSSLPRSKRQEYLNLFSKKKISILIASDLVSRGLDLPNLAHVINYDVPTSLVSYVHRVGRTARAGKSGNAWTLFTSTQASWFWNEISRSPHILRSQEKIERFKFKDFSTDEKKKTYQVALEKLEKEALRPS